MAFVIFTGKSVLLGNGFEPATLLVDTDSGHIVDIKPGYCVPMAVTAADDAEVIDCTDYLVMPGLVDAHVHLNEPGRTRWEGFYTGTRAAAAGGITTVVDMPLNSIPPTTTVEHLRTKRTAAQGQCFCDVAFWGGVIPGNQMHLKSLIQDGVKGFKCFMIESGVDEFPCVSESEIRAALKELEGTDTVLMFHAELDIQPRSVLPDNQGPPTEYATFLTSRPQSLEYDAISLVISLLRENPSVRCHIVHLSAASALPLIRDAKASGLKLTVETCFHYLCLSSDAIPNSRPDFKCCPPIRDSANCDALWAALIDGTIDFVVSDHSPCTLELKKMDEGDVMGAWGGISSLGLGLSLLWTEASKRGMQITDIIPWLTSNPARHAGLESRKGRLIVGYDADLFLWCPNAQKKISSEGLLVKNKLTPYDGQAVLGEVSQTYVRGKRVYSAEDANRWGPCLGTFV